MSEHSKIEWCDATWNPTTGCSKQSPGCAGCYAIKDAHRLSHNPNDKVRSKYAGTVTPDGKNWTGKVNLVHEALDFPFTLRQPSRIFVNSMSDLFHPNVPFWFVDDVVNVMQAANWHTFQVLTKQAERAFEYFDSTSSRVKAWPDNAWLGFSAENQEWFDRRWEHFKHLAGCGWPIFVSCEPLLGPVTLPADFLALGRRAQVITGGESGRGAKSRPMNPAWPRHLKGQCDGSEVAYFHKQNGDWVDEHNPAMKSLPILKFYGKNSGKRGVFDTDGNWRHGEGEFSRYENLGGLRMYRVGKKASGRLLDGETWSQFPATTPEAATAR